MLVIFVIKPWTTFTEVNTLQVCNRWCLRLEKKTKKTIHNEHASNDRTHMCADADLSNHAETRPCDELLYTRWWECWKQRSCLSWCHISKQCAHRWFVREGWKRACFISFFYKRSKIYRNVIKRLGRRETQNPLMSCPAVFDDGANKKSRSETETGDVNDCQKGARISAQKK